MQGAISFFSLMSSSSDTLWRTFIKFGTGVQCKKGFHKMHDLGGSKLWIFKKWHFDIVGPILNYLNFELILLIYLIRLLLWLQPKVLTLTDSDSGFDLGRGSAFVVALRTEGWFKIIHYRQYIDSVIDSMLQTHPVPTVHIWMIGLQSHNNFEVNLPSRSRDTDKISTVLSIYVAESPTIHVGVIGWLVSSRTPILKSIDPGGHPSKY